MSFGGKVQSSEKLARRFTVDDENNGFFRRRKSGTGSVMLREFNATSNHGYYSVEFIPRC